MIPSIRAEIESLGGTGSPSNLSLYFNRLCPAIDHAGEHRYKEDAIRTMAAGYDDDTLALYRQALKDWYRFVETDEDTDSFEMGVTAPLVVGKGDQNVHEFGMTLQLPWATPVIPGSAVKGVVSTFAHDNGVECWHKGPLATRDNNLSAVSGLYALAMFGGMDAEKNAHAGCIGFLDAWWVPEGNGSPFMADIINVHHLGYYQKENRFPDGMDSPVPNKFVVVRPGQRFVFALRGPAAWRALAKEILISAAEEYGFGAKTRVGYGRLSYCKGVQDLTREIPDLDDKALADLYAMHKNDNQLHEAFRAEARKRPYTPALNAMFGKYRPAACFLSELQARNPQRWSDIKNIHKQFKKRLGVAATDPTDPAVQEIFGICRSMAPTPFPAWLAAMSPKPADYLAGKTGKEIEKFLETYDRAWPRLSDFSEAIENAGHLSDQEKEDCLVILELKLEDE